MIYKKRVVVVNDQNLATDINTEQRIYYRSKVGITPYGAAEPTMWITNTNDIYNETAVEPAAQAWTRKVTPIAENLESENKYLYLYTCIQRVNSLGQVEHTEILLDDTTTVIDGGNIITSSIEANRLNVAYLSAIKANLGEITAGTLKDGINGNNLIDLNNGTLVFKNNAEWDEASQGMKYDATGLEIKGAIVATSLTIRHEDTEATEMIVEDSLDSLQDGLHDQSLQMDELDNKIDNQSDSITDLQSKSDQHDKTIESLTTDLKNTTEAQQSLKSEVNIYAGRITAIEARNETVSRYVDISAGGIIVGSTQGKVIIESDKISICANETDTSAWFKADTMFTKRIYTNEILPRYAADFTDETSYRGGFSWIARSDGHLSLRIIN